MNGKNNKGIVRNIDSLGRIVIPKEFRKMSRRNERYYWLKEKREVTAYGEKRII